MINPKFIWLLHEPRRGDRRPLWTIERMAEVLYVNRPHLTDVLNNKPKHGAQTRPKVIKFFKSKFPERWPELLQELRWNEDASIKPSEQNVPRPTFHGEQLEEKA